MPLNAPRHRFFTPQQASDSPIANVLLSMRRSSLLIFASAVMLFVFELVQVILYIAADRPAEWTLGDSNVVDDEGRGIFAAQSVMSWCSCVMWIGRMITAPEVLPLLLSFDGLILLLTNIPMVGLSLCALGEGKCVNFWVPMYLRVIPLEKHLQQIVDSPSLRISTAARFAMRHIVHLLTVMVVAIGTYHIVEWSYGFPITMFDAFYYGVVTFGTIGYGDLSPQSRMGKLVAVGTIIVAMYEFPTFFQRMGSIRELLLRHAKYNPAKGYRHVVVAGTFTDQDILFVLDEFYGGDRALLPLNIVFVSPDKYSDEIRIRTKQFGKKVTLLVGDVSTTYMMKKCHIKTADAIFVLSDPSTSYQADFETVMASMAIHQHDSALPQHVLIGRAKNGKHVEDLVSNMLDIKRLQYSLMGIGAVYPGIVPLLINLIRTSGSDIDIRSQWSQEYAWSVGNEVYLMEAPLPECFVGKTFTLIVDLLSVIGLTAVGVYDDLERALTLNPKRSIESTDGIVIIAADDSDIKNARETFTQSNLPDFFHAKVSEHMSNEEESMQLSVRFAENFRSPRPVNMQQMDDDDAGSRMDKFASIIDKTLRLLEMDDEELTKLKDHFVIVDISAAQLPPTDISHLREHDDHFFRSSDYWNVVRAIKLARPQAEIVLLSREVPTIGFCKRWKQAGWRRMYHVSGSGLLRHHLEACKVDTAAGIAVISAGEHSVRLVDSMSLLARFTIRNILIEAEEHERLHTEPVHHAPDHRTSMLLHPENTISMALKSSFNAPTVTPTSAEPADVPVPRCPIIVEVNELDTVLGLPPFYTQRDMQDLEEENFAYSAAFVSGEVVCNKMLSPALFQGYFNAVVMSFLDAVLGGSTKGSVQQSVFTTVDVPDGVHTYQQAVSHLCKERRLVPLGIYRRITDNDNRWITGRYFMYTNPPPEEEMQSNDVLYVLL